MIIEYDIRAFRDGYEVHRTSEGFVIEALSVDEKSNPHLTGSDGQWIRLAVSSFAALVERLDELECDLQTLANNDDPWNDGDDDD